MPAITALLDNARGAETGGVLRQCLQKWDMAWWAVAYISKQGVRSIQDSLKHFIARGGRLRIITTGQGFITHPDGLAALRDLGIRDILFRPPGSVPLFHGKLYLFGNRGPERSAIIGSANLSDGGLEVNDELGLLVEGTAREPLFRGFEATLDRYRQRKSGFVPLTSDLLDVYRKDWRKYRPKRKPGRTTRTNKKAKRLSRELPNEVVRAGPGPAYLVNCWWPPRHDDPPRKKPYQLYFQSRYRTTLDRLRIGDRVFVYESATPPDSQYQRGTGGIFALVEIAGPPNRRPSHWHSVGGRRVRFDMTVPVRCISFDPTRRGVPALSALRVLNYGNFRLPSGLSKPLELRRALKLERLLERASGSSH